MTTRRKPPTVARSLADLQDGNAGTRAINQSSAAGLGYSLAEFGDIGPTFAEVAADRQPAGTS